MTPTRNTQADSPPDWTPNPFAHTLSLPEQIAERIGNDIIRGLFEPGAKVQEQDVAARFQVSRGPVREALRILERDGLVQINARRGAQVTELTVAQLNEIFDPRITLNGLTARRATERADAAAIARLKAAVDRLSSVAPSADTDTYVNAVYAAHRILNEAGGNPFLTRLVFLLAHQTLRYTRLGLATPKRRLQSARNWRRLLAAIQAGDVQEASQAAEQLVSDSRDTAVKLLTEEHARRNLLAEKKTEAERDGARESGRENVRDNDGLPDRALDSPEAARIAASPEKAPAPRRKRTTGARVSAQVSAQVSGQPRRKPANRS